MIGRRSLLFSVLYISTKPIRCLNAASVFSQRSVPRISSGEPAAAFHRRRTCASHRSDGSMDGTAAAAANGSEGGRRFGSFLIPRDSIFYETDATFAFVNLRPIVPGHVLVSPHRVAPRLEDLSEAEHADLWRAVRAVQRTLRVHYGCADFNVAVQDGRAAGQSVPHVHVHVLPRTPGDFERNDDVYDELSNWAPRDEMKVNNTLSVADDKDRRDRTLQEMTDEASTYRKLFHTDGDSRL